MQVMRFALRRLRRSPAFAGIAIGTMALAIGAAGVAFALLKTVVLTPLPYAHPDRLVTIAEGQGPEGTGQTISYATAYDLKARTRALESVAIWGDAAVRFLAGGRLDFLRGMRVTANYLDTLGARFALGRDFRPEEDAPGSHVIILTYDTWATHFGGDPAVVGRALPAEDGAYLVVGVLAPDFQPLHMSNDAEIPHLYVPLGYGPGAKRCRTCRGQRAIGRLRPGVSPGAARAELNVAMHEIAAGDPLEYPHESAVAIAPLDDQIVGRFRPALWMLQAAVLLLLLLGCANVATLLLARMIARRTEMAVRAAIGASRWQLLRYGLAESLLLAAAGGAAGTALAWIAIRVIAHSGDPNLPRLGELSPDASLFLVGGAATIVTAALCGVLPAVLGSRPSAPALRGDRSSTMGRPYQRLLHGLAAAELVFAFVLVCAVGLLGRSYATLTHLDLGYDPSHVLTLSLLPSGGYPAEHGGIAYFDAVVRQMRAIPGVENAGYASTLPLSHPSPQRIYVRERPLAHDADAPRVETYQISPDYFDVMRMRVREGRGFAATDIETAQPVAVVSTAAARTLFGGRAAIGAHVQTAERDDSAPWAEVVGVVDDVQQYGLDRSPDAAVYIPLRQAQNPQGWTSVAIRSSVPPETIEPQVRAAMAAVDPLQPVFHLQPMSRFIALSLSQRTLTLRLIAAFGALALALAVGGVYGVISFGVTQRTREVGLRLALGATPQSVRWLIGREVAAIAAVAVGAGFCLQVAFAKLLGSLLFAVTPLDPLTTAAVAAIMLLSAMAAGALPMRRAARIDPMTALRD
jgi:putative ABC transport system permease protein